MNKITRRDFVRTTSTAALWSALPASTANATVGQAATKVANRVDPMELVNPELRPALQSTLKMFSLPKIQGEVTAAQLAALRKLSLGVISRLQQPSVAERMVSGRAGAPDVRVFVINAKAGARRPAVLHTHGGGYVLGSSASDVPDLR